MDLIKSFKPGLLGMTVKYTPVVSCNACWEQSKCFTSFWPHWLRGGCLDLAQLWSTVRSHY